MKDIIRFATAGTIPNNTKKASPRPTPTHIQTRYDWDSSRAPAGRPRRGALVLSLRLLNLVPLLAPSGPAPGWEGTSLQALVRGGAPSSTSGAPPFLSKFVYFYLVQLLSTSLAASCGLFDPDRTDSCNSGY